MQGITFGMYRCSQSCLWAVMAWGRGPNPSGPPYSNYRLAFNLGRFVTNSIASLRKVWLCCLGTTRLPGQGAALSYARRYALFALVGIRRG
jgi:hypothetical protein